MVLLVDPHNELSIIANVNTSTFGPVSVSTDSVEKSVCFFKEDVFYSELSSFIFTEVLERVIRAREVACQMRQSLNNLIFDFETLLF